ncbi:hypothetical protein CP968_04020 [Streptomyces subrutilus]|uniref:Uncharacterized protein n=1 Tax=Streptomyces subrutilus TaxID=36818 RepID=A0A5P2UEC0_9ACTN|nr:hypothetical protein CP968_04020 [Streptomyces subrutilus]
MTRAVHHTSVHRRTAGGDHHRALAAVRARGARRVPRPDPDHRAGDADGGPAPLLTVRPPTMTGHGHERGRQTADRRPV